MSQQVSKLSQEEEYEMLQEMVNGANPCYSTDDVRRLYELEQKVNLD